MNNLFLCLAALGAIVFICCTYLFIFNNVKVAGVPLIEAENQLKANENIHEEYRDMIDDMNERVLHLGHVRFSVGDYAGSSDFDFNTGKKGFKPLIKKTKEGWLIIDEGMNAEVDEIIERQTKLKGIEGGEGDLYRDAETELYYKYSEELSDGKKWKCVGYRSLEIGKEYDARINGEVKKIQILEYVPFYYHYSISGQEVKFMRDNELLELVNLVAVERHNIDESKGEK